MSKADEDQDFFKFDKKAPNGKKKNDEELKTSNVANNAGITVEESKTDADSFINSLIADARVNPSNTNSMPLFNRSLVQRDSRAESEQTEGYAFGAKVPGEPGEFAND